MHEALIHVLALIGTGLSIVRMVPTFVKIRRTGEVEGVSDLSLAFFSVSGVFWVVLSIDLRNLPSTISSIAGMAVSVASMYALWQRGGVRRNVMIGTIVGSGIGLLAFTHVRFVGAVAAVTGALIAIPQAWQTIRHPETVEDVSSTTWAIVSINAAVWLLYGILIGDPVLGASGVITLPAALWVWFDTVHSNRTARRAAGATAAGAETLVA